MAKPKSYKTGTHPKTLLLGICAPSNKTRDIQSYYDEFEHLVRSDNIEYDQILFMKLRSIDTTYFLTKGKLEEVRAICEKNKIEEVIISESLSAQQERNLSDLFQCRVFDRTQLILEIFEKSAHSGEGKLQVSIAMLQHQKSRTSGKGIDMSQQDGGHVGGRGPGETAKEKEMRVIDQLINKHRQNLKSLESTRNVQRKRRNETNVPQICLIGYTNTGKSTLLNLLAKSDVLVEDKLFVTLDTTTRELYINGTKKGILSDTVGFIQQLPHTLIDAFKSTLRELQDADLLLHVIDIADKNWETHIAVVNEILRDLGVDQTRLYVFNKADKPEELHIPAESRKLYTPNVVISAQSKEGIAPLIDFLHNWNKE